jgi:hypothetical protein
MTRATFLILNALMFVVAAPPMFGQSFPYEVFPAPGGVRPDSLVGAVDSIDPISGGLHMNIPIASLPAGPGPGFTLGLVYDSQIYSVRQWFDDWPELVFFQQLQATGGWRLNYQNIDISTEAHIFGEALYYEGCEGLEYKPRTIRVSAALPDGSNHRLHLNGDGDNDGDTDEYAPGFYH